MSEVATIKAMVLKCQSFSNFAANTEFVVKKCEKTEGKKVTPYWVIRAREYGGDLETFDNESAATKRADWLNGLFAPVRAALLQTLHEELSSRSALRVGDVDGKEF